MLAKAIAIFALVAAVNGGLLADPHIGAQSEHTVRGFGGLSSVSQYSKAVDSPFSSVRKTDTRVTNDAVSAYVAPAYAHQAYAAAPAYAHQAYAAAPLAVAHHGYAAPALGHAYAAPALGHAYAAPALGHAYAAAPLAHTYAHAAPVAVAHHGYAAAPLAAVAHHGYAAAPLAAVAHHGYAAAPVGHAYASNIGHHYSAVSPAVANLHFSGLGLGTYGY